MTTDLELDPTLTKLVIGRYLGIEARVAATITAADLASYN